MESEIIHLKDLLRRSFRALRHPREAFQNVAEKNEKISEREIAPILFTWGMVFIVLNFGFAQRVSIFSFGHFWVTLPSIGIYSYLLWRLGSLTFFTLGRVLKKNVSLAQTEIGAFYLWFVWAIMPLFDLPHLLLGIPMWRIFGIGAHLSWFFGFPYLIIFSFYLLRELLSLRGKKELSVVVGIAFGLPFFGRFFVEQLPQWLHLFVRDYWGGNLAPGFHLASLLIVLITLIWAHLWKKVITEEFDYKLSAIITQKTLLSLSFIGVWILLLPLGPTLRQNWLPLQVYENYISGRSGIGTSLYTHSYTWTGSDLESGTITHGPQAASSSWTDYYTNSIDFDFNPTAHEINSITFTVHFNSATLADTTGTRVQTGPRAQLCLLGNAGTDYYCSSIQDNFTGSSTLSFTLAPGSIFAFSSSSFGGATSSQAWTDLTTGLRQDDNSLNIHTYTRGGNDTNVDNGDVVSFDSVVMSVNYRDTGELAVAIATSTTVASTTALVVGPALTIPSSSLPAGRYLVFYGAQLAQTTTTGPYWVYGQLDRTSSTVVILGKTFPYLNSASSSNPQHGDAVNGVWLGDLNGTEVLRLSYRAHIGGGIAYIGDRYLMAIRLDGTLAENTDYWIATSTDVTDVASSTLVAVASTTRTFSATTTQPYLVMGYMEVLPNGTVNNGCKAQLRVDSTEVNGSSFTPTNVGDNGFVYYNFVQLASTSIATGTKTIDLRAQSTGDPLAAGCDIANPRIYVFRSNIFEPIGHAQYAFTELSQSTPYVSSSVATMNYTPLSVQNLIVLSNPKLNSVTSTFSTLARILETTTGFTTAGIPIQNTSGSSALTNPFWPVLSGGLMQSVSTSTKTFVAQYGNFPNLVLAGGVDNSNIFIWPVRLARNLTQAGYRWFSNADATSTGAVLAATNTAAIAPAQGTPFRLKLLLHNQSSTLPAKSQPFKLQFAARSSTCDTSFSGETYADVQRSSGAIRFYDNPSVSDAAAISASSTDPSNGTSTIVVQSYEEANSFVANVSTSYANHDAMWDFSLVDSAAVASTSYCFRVVKNDTSTLDSYTSIPEIRTSGATPVLGSVTLNNGSNIVPIAATTTRIYASSTVTDADGAGDIWYATSTFYRSGVGVSCSNDGRNCYQVASSSCSFGASTTTVACYADIQYFAQATGNASSSFPSESWQAAITVTDRQGLTITSSSAANAVHVDLLTAIDTTTSSISYASSQLSPGQNTGSSTQQLTVLNFGNTSTTLKVSGTNLTAGVNTIDVSNEHYASATFTYGGTEKSLTGSVTTFTGLSLNAPPHQSSSILEANLPYFIAYHNLQAYNGYLYIAGGTVSSSFLGTANPTSAVRYAQISATGTPINWSSTTALPAASFLAGGVAHNGYLYNVGGLDVGSAITSTVRFAQLQSDGTINNWSSTTALPSARMNPGVVVYNGYLYVLGGNTVSGGSTATSSVIFAPINATGSLGSWSSTTALPGTKEVARSAFAYNGYMYQVGNRDNGNFILGTPTATVVYAPINANGSLGSWSTTTPFLSAVADASVKNISSTVFVTVGNQNLYYGTIKNGGGIQNWYGSIARATSTITYLTALWNGRLYMNGGYDISGLLATNAADHISLNSRDTYWGVSIPYSTPSSTYTGTITFTSSFTE